MRAQPEVVRLGAGEWLVRPLTVAQVQAIEPLLAETVAAPGASIASAVAILRVALGRDHAAAAAGLADLEAGAPAIAAAMATVLRLGCFLPPPWDGAPTPGEAGAGQAPALDSQTTRPPATDLPPASTGAPSTPA